MNRILDTFSFISRQLFNGLAWAFFILLALSGCSVFPSASATPIDVVFDAPLEEVEGGVRLAPTESQWDGYGEAIDVHGDVMVVGAPEWNHCGAGSAYVYRLSGGEWQQEAQLIASDKDAFIQQAQQFEGMRFGTAVAIGEGIIAVGAPGNVPAEAGGGPGAVYLYEHDGKTWVEIAKLTPDNISDSTQEKLTPAWCSRFQPNMFGAMVALDGDTLAVGKNSGGEIYIYYLGEDSWQEQARVQIPIKSGRELYITSISLFGDTLALSAYYMIPQGESQDQVPILSGNVIMYVFERADNVWEESFQFAPEGETDILFFREVNVGASVTLGGTSGAADRLAIGLPGFPDWRNVQDNTWLFGNDPEQIPEFPPSNRQTGAVYLFERTENNSWNQTATIKPSGWETPPGMGSMDYPAGLTHLDENPSEEELKAFYASFVFPGDIYSELPEVSFFGATVDLEGDQLAVTAGFANATYVFEWNGESWLYRFSVKPANEKGEVWEDYAQIVKISGSTLLLGTPGEFGNSAYVFDLCTSNCE